MSTDKGTWARLAAQPGPNPLWAHPLVAYVWLGIAGWWASRSGLPWAVMLAGGVLLVPVGLLVGRILVRKAGRDTALGREIRDWARSTAGAGLLVNAVWCTYATATNVVQPIDITAWGVLAAALLPVALMYAHVRALLLEHGGHGTAPSATVLAIEVAASEVQTVHTPEADEFTQVLVDAGCGAVRVVHWDDQWSGPLITVELAPDNETARSVIRGKLETVTRRLARAYRARGVTLADGAVTMVNGATPDQIKFRVRTRDVLAEDIPVPADEGPTTCNLPLWIGLYESGADLDFDIRWMHGAAVGATGSGKSTYENMIVYQLTRCVDAIVWMCGTSKLLELAGPWMQALADGRADHSVIDFVAGQEWEDVERMLRVTYLLIKVRETAPRTTYRRAKNRYLPTPDQPLVHMIVEEADTVMKSPKLIDIPGEPPMTAGAVLMYITSKGRQYAVQAELLNQGVTQNKMGNLATEIKDSCHRLAAFYTRSKMMGQWALPDGVDTNVFNTSLLPEHCMYLTLGREAEPMRGKAAYIEEENAIPEAAIRHQTWITTLEPYAQKKLKELLGPKYAGDYADRWSYERTQVWRDYFGEFPHAPSGDSSVPASGTRTAENITQPKPSPGKTGGEWGEKDGVPGWWFGGRTFFLPDMTAGTANTGNAASLDAELSPEWQGTLDQIRGLDVAEPVRPARHPVPEPLATIVTRLAGDGREFVTNNDLAALAGTDDTLGLGKQLSAQGVPARKKGDNRGRAVAELRAAAEAWRRGESPSVSDD
jgi:hypothetical protein